MSSIPTSRIGFGTARLHHLPAAADRRRLLSAALDAGLTHFDTSPLYGFGLAEVDLGDALSHRRTEVTIATKFGLYPPGGRARSRPAVVARKALGKLLPWLSRPVVDFSVHTAERSLVASLGALRTDYVDVLFLHEPEISLAAADELAEWLQGARRRGLLRTWGVAGRPELCRQLADARHPVAATIQTALTPEGTIPAGLTPRFVYGAHAASHGGADPFRELVRRVLAEYPVATVLVSTTRLARIADIASIQPGATAS